MISLDDLKRMVSTEAMVEINTLLQMGFIITLDPGGIEFVKDKFRSAYFICDHIGLSNLKKASQNCLHEYFADLKK